MTIDGLGVGLKSANQLLSATTPTTMGQVAQPFQKMDAVAESSNSGALSPSDDKTNLREVRLSRLSDEERAELDANARAHDQREAQRKAQPALEEQLHHQELMVHTRATLRRSASESGSSSAGKEDTSTSLLRKKSGKPPRKPSNHGVT